MMEETKISAVMDLIIDLIMGFEKLICKKDLKLYFNGVYVMDLGINFE